VLRLAEGLDACNSQNILHRDIKPANVMLFPVACGTLPFWPKLTDFGLAKTLDFDLELTASNEWVGTPRYMAAEQISDARGEIGTATDVYSLGAVLYELIAGRPPFDANELPMLFDQIRASQPVLPRSLRPQLPEALEAICLTCLQRSVANRYATARELADDLVRFLDGQPTLAKKSSTKRVAIFVRSIAAAVSLLRMSAAFAAQRICPSSNQSSLTLRTASGGCRSVAITLEFTKRAAIPSMVRFAT
jgi:eukaryotic-like serine/threonine-protein kinase